MRWKERRATKKKKKWVRMKWKYSVKENQSKKRKWTEIKKIFEKKMS